MQPKQFNAIMTHYSPKVDNSFRLSFTTGELDGDAVKEIHDRFYKQHVWVVVFERELKKEDLNNLPPTPNQKPDGGGKSRSQILRACLFRLWKGNPSYSEPFEEFYESRLDKFITEVKSELNSLNGV